MKKLNAIVFGGSGFIGSHVADLLSKSNYNVTIYDRVKSNYLRKDQKMIIGDINDLKKINKITKNIDVIYHFAGIADIYEANENPLLAVEKNILGTVCLLESAVKNNVKRFIFASSIYVFSEQGGIYRTTKQSCELLIENYNKNHNLNFTNLRFGSLYGPRANKFNFINKMIHQALTKKQMIRDGDGNDIRNYINVIDAAKYCLEATKTKYKNKVVLIRGSEKVTIKKILSLIKSKINKNIQIEYTGVRDFAHYRTTPYNFKIRKPSKISIKDEITLSAGIDNAIKEIKQKK